MTIRGPQQVQQCEHPARGHIEPRQILLPALPPFDEGGEPVVLVAAQHRDGVQRVLGERSVHRSHKFLETPLNAQILGLVDHAPTTVRRLEVDETDGAATPMRITAAGPEVTDPAVDRDPECRRKSRPMPTGLLQQICGGRLPLPAHGRQKSPENGEGRQQVLQAVIQLPVAPGGVRASVRGPSSVAELEHQGGTGGSAFDEIGVPSVRDDLGEPLSQIVPQCCNSVIRQWFQPCPWRVGRESLPDVRHHRRQQSVER